MLALVLLVACTKPVDDTDVADTDIDDTDATLPASPCLSSEWAGADPAVAVHVKPGATGSGTAADPMGDVGDAIAAAVAAGSKQVFLWPGSYSAAIQLTPDEGDTSYDGLQIVGCSSSEVEITAPAEEAQVVTLRRATGVAIGGVTLTGGTVGVWARDLATVTLTDVVVDNTLLMGVLAEGATGAGTTTVTVSDVTVDGTDAVDGEGGFGVVARTGGLVTGGELHVANSVGAGIVVDAGSLDLDGFDVTDTTAYVTGDHAGLYGRGLNVQDGDLSVTHGVFTGNVDVGIWIARSLGTISETSVSDVSAGVVPDTLTATGDGIVLSGRDPDPDHELDPSVYVITLTDNTVDGVARAGIFADNVSPVLSGNAATSTGPDCAICYDPDSIPSGPDVGSVAVPIAAPLDTNRVNVGVPNIE
jgi:hypothetical protein